jgi:hypothetical protein
MSKASLVYSLACHNFPPLAEYSRVLTLAYDVAQLGKTWSYISMMVPTLKLCPSSVKALVMSVINGTSVDAELLAVFDILLFQTYRSMM